MKKTLSLSFIVATILFSACAGNTGKDEAKAATPKPGTIVAAAEMPIKEDSLNHFSYSVKVIADSNVAAGIYDVDADYGPNLATGQFTMPKGGESLVPLIRVGSKPYTYIIGFKVANDTTFYDYFEVSSDGKSTKMQYLNSYTF